MRAQLLTLGGWKQPAMRSLFEDYATRCQPRLNLVELALPAREAKTGELKEKEAALLLKHWPKQGTVIACDERGKQVSSRELATWLQQAMDKNGPEVTFIVGGADGLHDSIVQRADLKLGLGSLTWPHLLVRVLLAEQIYRAQAILAGHPYHRD